MSLRTELIGCRAKDPFEVFAKYEDAKFENLLSKKELLLKYMKIDSESLPYMIYLLAKYLDIPGAKEVIKRLQLN